MFSVLEAFARSEADLIVCAGGVSVGDRDYVKPALERLGMLELWRIALSNPASRLPSADPD